MGLDKGEITCMVAHQIATNKDVLSAGKEMEKFKETLMTEIKNYPDLRYIPPPQTHH